MIQHLAVRNLALLAEAELEFAPGFNVITGETGEGKSLVLGAIALALGGRARADLVRRGAEVAEIELALALGKQGAERLSGLCTIVAPGDTEIVFGRTLRADGGSKANLNGRLCTAAMQAELGGVLIGFHAQDEQRLFREPAEQVAMLDAFAGTADEVAVWCRDRARGRDLLAEMTALKAALSQRDARQELLTERLNLLQRLKPRVGEETELAAELKLLSGGRDLIQALAATEAVLASGDDAAADAAGRARKRLAAYAGGNEALAQLVARIESLAIEARDIAVEARAIAERLESDPDRLHVVERRLEELRDAARKLRISADELPALREQMETELAGIAGGDEKLAELAREVEEVRACLRASGSAIMQRRKAAAVRLKRSVEAVLAGLRMEKARIEVEFMPPTMLKGTDPLEPGPAGPGGARFLLAANPGEEAQPVEHVASGGELSRMLLALTSALARAFTTPVLVLDEVDAGVSGRTAAALGRHLAELAMQRQVISVTHLPQVAAHAGRHWKVSKCVEGGRTVTTVRELRGEERIQELAEMLGGATATATARAQARALLTEAGA